MASYRTVFFLLTLTLSVSMPQSTAGWQCAEMIDDPRSVFNQSKIHTEPLAEYLATDLIGCMVFCCDDEISCNVGVFLDLPTSDTNCWLYSCRPLDACAMKIRRGTEVFVARHSMDYTHINTSNSPDYLPSVYEDYNADKGSDVYGTAYDNNEAYRTDGEVSNLLSTLESVTVSTPASMTADLAAVTEPETTSMTADLAAVTEPETTSTTADLAAVTEPETTSKTGDLAAVTQPETTPVSLVGENKSSLSLTGGSYFQNSTFTIPDIKTVFENDTFSPTFYEVEWENHTQVANIGEETGGNNTSESLFNKENDTAHENDNVTSSSKDENNTENITVWPAEKLTSIESSFSLSASLIDSSSSLLTSRIESSSSLSSSRTTVTTDQVSTSVHQTWPSKDSTMHQTDTTFYSAMLTDTQILASSDWSTPVVSTSTEVVSTTHLSTLQSFDSVVSLESVMPTSTVSDVSSTWVMAGDGVASLYESSQSAVLPQQPATLTTDTFLASDLQSQHSQNGTESRADVDYQPSEATTGLLISALTVGCVCALAVVSVLSLRLYDGYKKRHYSRLDYLVNGIYN